MATEKKISVKKTTGSLKNTLFVVAGLFAGGLVENYLMSKVAFLADEKDGKTNTVGVLAKSALYIVGGTLPGQLMNNEAAKWAGYGLSAYGALKAAKSFAGNKGKVYGLGGLTHYRDPQFPSYQLPKVAAPVARASSY